MLDDLATRARKRAEELEAKRAAAAEGMWLNAGYDRDRGQTVIAGKHGFTVLQTYGLVDVMRGNANFVVHAANSATDQVALLLALADRVDEQERRIKELEGEKKRLQLEVLDTQGRFISFQNQVSAMAAQISEALSQKGGE